jgi:hypothetical protein
MFDEVLYQVKWIGTKKAGQRLLSGFVLLATEGPSYEPSPRRSLRPPCHP